MSKQYLTLHTIDAAHLTDIFSLAPTPTTILSASGQSSILVHSTQSPDFPLVQEIKGAHKLGCHHVTVSGESNVAASAGFGGEVKIWSCQSADAQGEAGSGAWKEAGKLNLSKKAGEVWALSLDAAGRFLASSSYDGRIAVWDLGAGLYAPESWEKVREYETKGSFGLCVAMSPDGRFVASGHENGSIYVFSLETGKLMHSLPGLIQPVRAVAFSPLSTLLAAGGDSQLISLSSVSSGETLTNLRGHSAWVTTLSFNHSGEYLLSGDFAGKARVWSVESRQCVATHGEGEKGIWSAVWLPKNFKVGGGMSSGVPEANGSGPGAGAGSTGGAGGVGAVSRSEMFAVAGAGRSISFYREASGG